MKKIGLFVFIVLITGFWASDVAEASAYVTQAAGGEAISADDVGTNWTSLSPIIIREGMPGDVRVGDIIFVAPSGFEFNSEAVPDVAVSGSLGLSAHLTSVSHDQIKITVNQSSTAVLCTLIIGALAPIQVRPTSSILLQGNIYMSTSSVEGVIPGPVGTNFGSFQVVPSSKSEEASSQEPTTEDDTPADETPADETPADETPADDTPADGTPADDTPAEEGTPAEEPTVAEMEAFQTVLSDIKEQLVILLNQVLAMLQALLSTH